MKDVETIARRVIAAEKEIVGILAKLEADTDMVVDAVKLLDIEVTSISDDREQWLRNITIEMKRNPGTRWNR